MNIILASDIQFDSIVDGPGLRAVVWFQGCIHNCLNCQNPQTHDIEGGFKTDTDSIIEEILSNPMQTGVTLSGGDPLLQSEAAIDIAKKLKEHNINVWCYTGFTWDVLQDSLNARILFKYIDVLVDGPYIDSLQSYDSKFRGSSNQRLIDVQKSLKENKIILWEEI
jgi:anaerobic ribonucleoside-triphosphate reductase activating protein